jgi:glycosyltransferase involved in cell wall biosynthesis
MPAELGGLGLGQAGLKLSRSLSACAWEVTTVSSRGGQTAPEGVHSTTVRSDRVYRWAIHSPLRFREDWLGAATFLGFDLLCARSLASCDWFYGCSLASLQSLRRARRLGALTALYAATTHVARMKSIVDAEYRRLGMAPSAVTAFMVKRAVREYAESDLIRAESTLVRASLLEAGVNPSKIVLVPPAVDLDDFRPAAEKDDHEFVACFVGAFSVRKGFHHLLAAWELVADGTSRLVLHGGYGNRWAKALVARALSRPDVTVRLGGPPHSTYAAADVCVVPSIEDGFCYVVLEAMACGLPVVITDQVGARDLVHDGVEGYVVPAGDPQALAAAIDCLRADPALCRRMGAAARRRAEEHSFAAEGQALSAALGGAPALAPRP